MVRKFDSQIISNTSYIKKSHQNLNKNSFSVLLLLILLMLLLWQVVLPLGPLVVWMLLLCVGIAKSRKSKATGVELPFMNSN